MGSKAENKVSFVGALKKPARIFEYGGTTVKLFLQGDTQRGSVYVPVSIHGELAEKVKERASAWQEGDEFFVEGELDWESYERGGEKKYQLIINAFRIQKIEAF